LFSSEQAQQALKSQYRLQQSGQAVGQLSDEDLAKLAARSRQVQHNSPVENAEAC